MTETMKGGSTWYFVVEIWICLPLSTKIGVCGEGDEVDRRYEDNGIFFMVFNEGLNWSSP